MKKTIFISLVVYVLSNITSNAIAENLTGSYVGLRCNTEKACRKEMKERDNSMVIGIKGVVDFFGLGSAKHGRVILINHNEDKNTIDIYIPEDNISFQNASINNKKEFDGKDPPDTNNYDKCITGNLKNDTFYGVLKNRCGATNEDKKVYLAKISPIDRIIKEDLQEARNETIKIQQDMNSLKTNNDIQITNKNNTINEKNNTINNQKSTIDSQNQEIQNLKKKLNQHVTIDTKNLNNNHTVDEDVNLRKLPDKSSIKITLIKKDDPITKLFTVQKKPDWSLVVTGNKGLIGYIKSNAIISLDAGPGEGPSGPDDCKEEDNCDDIQIIKPKWDKGKVNQQMTLQAPGFQTIRGKINNLVDIEYVIINDEEANFDKQTQKFDTVINFTKGKKNVDVVVIKSNGKQIKLSFVVIVN